MSSMYVNHVQIYGASLLIFVVAENYHFHFCLARSRPRVLDLFFAWSFQLVFLSETCLPHWSLFTPWNPFCHSKFLFPSTPGIFGFLCVPREHPSTHVRRRVLFFVDQFLPRPAFHARRLGVRPGPSLPHFSSLDKFYL
jgi:hypothetical protein